MAGWVKVQRVLNEYVAHKQLQFLSTSVPSLLRCSHRASGQCRQRTGPGVGPPRTTTPGQLGSSLPQRVCRPGGHRGVQAGAVGCCHLQSDSVSYDQPHPAYLCSWAWAALVCLLQPTPLGKAQAVCGCRVSAARAQRHGGNFVPVPCGAPPCATARARWRSFAVLTQAALHVSWGRSLSLFASSQPAMHVTMSCLVATMHAAWVRLVSGSIANNMRAMEGRLEVRMWNGSWSTVCDDGFTDAAASVVCRQVSEPAGERACKLIVVVAAAAAAVVVLPDLPTTRFQHVTAGTEHHWICSAKRSLWPGGRADTMGQCGLHRN